MQIEFFWEGIPPKSTAQQRRQTRQGGYLNPLTKKAKATWLAIVEKYAPAKPLEGALHFRVSLTWPHTKATAKENNGLAVPKTTRPDDDNCLKLLKDAMTKAGYWNDDSQTAHTEIYRWHGEMPGVYIAVCTWNDNVAR